MKYTSNFKTKFVLSVLNHDKNVLKSFHSVRYNKVAVLQQYTLRLASVSPSYIDICINQLQGASNITDMTSIVRLCHNTSPATFQSTSEAGPFSLRANSLVLNPIHLEQSNEAIIIQETEEDVNNFDGVQKGPCGDITLGSDTD